MATGRTDIDKEILNCSICLEQFNNPKYLPCLHTFCESCLQSYIDTEVSKGQSSDFFRCPICRVSVKPPDPNLPVDKWVEQIPNNHLIASLLDSYSRKDGSCKRMCDPCNLPSEENEAKYWCGECMEALCDNCASCHRRMKVSRNHKIVSVNDMKENPMKMADIDEPCHEHKGKMLEVYCINHGKMCCVICLATKHRECKHIKTIDEMAEQVATKSNATRFTQQLEKIEAMTKTLGNKKQHNIVQVDKKYIDILSSMTNSVAEAKTKLDQLLDLFKNELDHLHKQQRQLLIDRKERIESFEKTVLNGYKMIQVVADRGNPKQLFVTTEKVKSLLSGHMEHLKHDLTNDQSIDYNFSFSEIINNITGMNSVGRVKLVTSLWHDEMESVISCVKSCCSLQIDGGSPTTHFSADIENIEAVKVAEIKSEGSFFTGGVFLDGGNILFADSDDRKLQRYDVYGKVICVYPLKKAPLDIARSSQDHDEIYVSFYKSRILGKYRIGDSLESLKEIKFGEDKVYIDVVRDRVILSSKNKIEIIDESGSVIRSLPRVPSKSSFWTQVAACTEDSKLYYHDSNAVVCCSLNGIQIFRHRSQLLNDSVSGIALDRNENVFVCCFSTGMIYMISKDGARGKVLLSNLNGISHPIAIGFDKTGKNLFVTSNAEEITAQIYKLAIKE